MTIDRTKKNPIPTYNSSPTAAEQPAVQAKSAKTNAPAATRELPTTFAQSKAGPSPLAALTRDGTQRLGERQYGSASQQSNVIGFRSTMRSTRAGSILDDARKAALTKKCSTLFGFNRRQRAAVDAAVEHLADAIAAGSGLSSPLRSADRAKVADAIQMVFDGLEAARAQGLALEQALAVLAGRLDESSLFQLHAACSESGMSSEHVPALYRGVRDFASTVLSLLTKRAS